jgi:hypothetical protein
MPEIYQLGATAASQPSPNALTQKNPLNSPAQGQADLNTAWIQQGKRLILQTSDASSRRLRLAFGPNNGASVNYAIQLWAWNELDINWVKLGEELALTDHNTGDLQAAGNQLIYVQVVSVSAGTLDIVVLSDGFKVWGA